MKNDVLGELPEEIREKYEAIFDDLFAKAKQKAEAEAAKIIEDAKQKASKKPKIKNTRGEEEVSYVFFKDDGEYSDDVYISVNCEKIVCRRGVPVKIKRKFVWAYEQAQRQQRAAANIVAANEKMFTQRMKDFI